MGDRPDITIPAEWIAQQFHAAYEELAPDHGYRTRESSAKPWAEVPESNRALMVATVQRLLDQGAIHAAAVGLADALSEMADEIAPMVEALDVPQYLRARAAELRAGETHA